MARARKEYTIVVAILGVLVAIGVPAWHRGELVVAAACLTAATLVTAWLARELWRG